MIYPRMNSNAEIVNEGFNYNDDIILSAIFNPWDIKSHEYMNHLESSDITIPFVSVTDTNGI